MQITYVILGALLGFIVFSPLWFSGYMGRLRYKIYQRAKDELRERPAIGDVHKEWYHLSWAKDEDSNPIPPNPIRVIALADKEADTMNDAYRAFAHLASSFYSQVKYLLRMRHPLTAIAFFLESRKWAALALEKRSEAREKNPIDLEVLGAPDFMLAQIPVVKYFFKKRALTFLEQAEDEIPFERDDKESLAAALIWSKIYALTKDRSYQDFIRLEGLHHKMDNNQLARISKHLGFDGSVDRLLDFCGQRN